jgi:hypothetical protein
MRAHWSIYTLAKLEFTTCLGKMGTSRWRIDNGNIMSYSQTLEESFHYRKEFWRNGVEWYDFSTFVYSCSLDQQKRAIVLHAIVWKTQQSRHLLSTAYQHIASDNIRMNIFSCKQLRNKRARKYTSKTGTLTDNMEEISRNLSLS